MATERFTGPWKNKQKYHSQLQARIQASVSAKQSAIQRKINNELEACGSNLRYSDKLQIKVIPMSGQASDRDSPGFMTAGLVHLSGMTTLQELSLVDCHALQEGGMVQNLRGLSLRHSLAKINVSPLMHHSISKAGKDLPCEWFWGIHLSQKDWRRLIRHMEEAGFAG